MELEKSQTTKRVKGKAQSTRKGKPSSETKVVLSFGELKELMGTAQSAVGSISPTEVADIAAQAAAKATEQLTKEAQEMMAKQQQLGQFDPMVQIKQQEVAIKGQEVQRKQQDSQQKQAVDIEKEKMKATVDMNKIRSDEKIQREKMRSQEKIAQITKKIDVM